MHTARVELGVELLAKHEARIAGSLGGLVESARRGDYEALAQKG